MMHFRATLKPSHSLIDLTPLVDVIFLLLIFFIVTSDILPLKSLNIQHPVVDRQSTPLTTQLLVVMDAQNVIYVGSKKAIVDFASLKDHLRDELAKLKQQQQGIEPTLVISVDRRVEYGAFLRLFSIAQETGSKLRLAYQNEEGSEV